MCNLRAVLSGLVLAAFMCTAQAATDTVTNTNDSGAGSLRAVIAAAASGDTIDFNLASYPATITLTSGVIAVSNLTIAGPGATNLAISGGGTSGVFQTSGTVTISGLTIENGNAGQGGGINNSGTLTVTNCTISGNTATGGGPFDGQGGGIYTNGSLTITNSAVLNNIASGNNSLGGGIFAYHATITVTNSTLSGNTAGGIGQGGAVLDEGGTLSLNNSTVAGNTPDGITGATNLKNTILAGNGGHNCDGGLFTDDGYTISDDTSCLLHGTGDQNNVNPKLDPAGPQFNGGPTQTIALQTNSPAIDAIPVASCTDTNGSSVTTDQRGVFRPHGPGCTIGAFEYDGPIIVTQTFNPAIVPLNSPSTFAITIRNPGPSGLTNLSFLDNFPAGIELFGAGETGDPANPVIGCWIGGASNVLVHASTASLAASTTCLYEFQYAFGVQSGVWNNTFAMTSGQGSTDSTGTLTVVAPPTLSKSFNPPGIPVNGTSTLTFTIANPAGNPSTLAGITFNDLLPVGLTIAAPTNNLVNNCSGASITAAPGSAAILFVSGTLTSGASCTFSLTVTGLGAGSYTNTVPSIGSQGGGTGPGASATLDVLAPPTVAKSFSPSTILVNGTTTLSFVLSNPNSSTIDASFTDTLPSGLVVATPPNASNGCAGTFAPSPGATTVSYSNSALAANANCTMTVVVQATAGGMLTNSVTINSTAAGQGNTSQASLTVQAPTAMEKTAGDGESTLAGTVFPVQLQVTVLDQFNNPIQGKQVTFTVVPGPTGASGTFAATPTQPITTDASGVATAPVLTANGFPGTFTVVASDPPPLLTATFTLTIIPAAPDAFQIGYAANLGQGDAFIDITNNGASLTAGTNGNLCVNVYAFDPVEEMLACCACPVTPNGLASLSVNNALLANTLTGQKPSSVIVELLATTNTGTGCNAANVAPLQAGPGMRAWGTTLHASPGSGYELTENPFGVAALTAGELNHLTSFCGFIQGDGSGSGLCSGCSSGGK